MHAALLTTGTLLLVAFAGCIGGDGTIKDLGAPEWSAGNAWQWNTTGTLRYEAEYDFAGEDGESGRESSEEPIGPLQEIVEVLNTTLSFNGNRTYVAAYWNSDMDGQASTHCYDFEDYGVGNLDSYCMYGQQAVRLIGVRTQDLSDVVLGYEMDSQCSEGGSCRHRLSNLRQLDADPTYPLLDFPLTQGKRWGGPLGDGDGDPDELRWEFNARVAGATTVRTGPEALDAVRVEVQWRPTNLAEYREAVLEEARDEGWDVSTFEYNSFVRRTYYYAPDAGVVALTRAEFVEEVAAAGRDDDGAPFSFRERTLMNSERVLVGSQLFVKPERNLDYMARMVAGEVAIAQPDGSLPDRRNVAVSIQPESPAVNAAESTTASFAATVTSGNQTDGLEVVWRVFDYRNREVDRGSGPRLQAEFEEPGMYAVQADVFDARIGSVVASAQVPYEAYWDETIQHSRLYQTLLDDARYDFPVRPGIQYLEVTATRAPAGSAANQFATMRILDGDERAVYSDSGRGDYEFRVTEFDTYYVNDDDWTIEWRDIAGALEDVSIHIVQRYTAADGAAPSSGEMVHRLRFLPQGPAAIPVL